MAPSVRRYREKIEEAPPLLCVGVAAFLSATRPGEIHGLAADAAADDWRARWEGVDPTDEAALRAFAAAALRMWDLDVVAEPVADALVAIERDGCRAVVASCFDA